MKKGFSLIELLIVITIIGILAAIAIPSYSWYMDRVRKEEASNAVLSLKTAMERLRMDRGNYTITTLSDAFKPANLGKYGINSATFGNTTLAVTVASGTAFTIKATITKPPYECSMDQNSEKPTCIDK